MDKPHEILDNPLVFVILLTLAVFAVANGFIWLGGKTGSAGLRKFFLKGN